MTSDPVSDAPGRLDAEAQITLGLLDAVQGNSAISQRSLSRELGIALGLTNAYLRRCIRKGWIKASQAPANRYAYYLTPRGLSEKGRLTSRYLGQSLDLYRRARNEFDELFAYSVTRQWNAVALAGVGELAEISLLCASAYPLRVVGILQPGARATAFRALPVFRDLAAMPPFDGVVLTALKRPQALYDTLHGALPEERILAPALLKIARSAPTTAPKTAGEPP